MVCVEMMTRRRGLAGFAPNGVVLALARIVRDGVPCARRLGGDVLDRGNEVGEAFADAGAGFDDEVLAIGERRSTASAIASCCGRCS